MRVSTRLGISKVKAQDGLEIEVMSRIPIGSSSSNKPSLLFIHGSGAGGWIWDEHWLEYFASKGFPSLAVSLRGSEATGTVKGVKDPVDIKDHVSDLKKVLENLPMKSSGKPIVLGHSFGGLVLTKLCEDKEARNLISSAVWMCAVPPSGQGKMAARFLWTRPWQTLNILRGFAFGQVSSSPKLNRRIFYDKSISIGKVADYMVRLAKDAEIMEDLAGVEAQMLDTSGQAPWVEGAPFKRYVLGARQDYIVDPPAILETAKFVGASEKATTIIDGPGHNIMLGPRWTIGAEAVLNLLERSK